MNNCCLFFYEIFRMIIIIHLYNFKLLLINYETNILINQNKI